jgi:hypothetical protein
MKIIDLIVQNKLDEAKELIESHLNSIIAKRIEEKKRYVASDIYEEVEELDEANLVRMGRIQKIRRRIRRNKKGRITVQKNVRRSAIKGYRLSGNTVKRIPASVRIHKARMLKRYWKSRGKARLNRTLLKRKMSLRRRKSMGIR